MSSATAWRSATPESAAADARGCVAVPACGDGEICDEGFARCGPAGCETPDVDGDGQASVECGGADCDDADASRYTGNIEVCDTTSHDEDCDPSTYGYRDADSDGYGDARCCNGEDAARVCGDDCNDMAATVHPGEADRCDARDNDCDDAVDEDGSVLYLDCDGDGFGDTSVSRVGARSRSCRATTAPPRSRARPGPRRRATATTRERRRTRALPTPATGSTTTACSPPIHRPVRARTATRRSADTTARARS
ncbi:MAG: putative metal-binding motif-containing protein [Sandaracinaceae bacterium]|nr:putative metal-binding motif-containing protein [Sandaracinaceae bacterium]